VDLGAELCALGLRSGLDAVGITDAAVFSSTRAILRARKEEGLHAGMAFTYRQPERSTDPSRSLPGAASLLVAARGYRRREAEVLPPVPGGVIARYSWRDEYAPLRDALQVLADRLVAAGYRARVLVDDNGLVDKAAAVRAGLGWWGKNTLVLLPRLGSWYVLGSVVTDAPLRRVHAWSESLGEDPAERVATPRDTGELVAPGTALANGLASSRADSWAADSCSAGSDRVASERAVANPADARPSPARPRSSATVSEPPASSAPARTRPQQIPVGSCGSCTRCITACPTGAIVAPGVLDARRCLAWLLEAPGMIPRELRVAMGTRIYGCDDCQECCPVNRLADRRHPPSPPLSGDEAVVDLVELLRASDEELKGRFSRFYLAGSDVGLLRRNALVALANSVVDDAPAGRPPPVTPAVLAVVLSALASGPPVVVAHAIWAAARISRSDLAAVVRHRGDGVASHPDVRAELEAVAS